METTKDNLREVGLTQSEVKLLVVIFLPGQLKQRQLALSPVLLASERISPDPTHSEEFPWLFPKRSRALDLGGWREHRRTPLGLDLGGC
mmetsp:Transcript_38380/g.79805  ORF Transcript_38380/g.79805 Transcript_38380/m.79805 type:complete len:89 (+) Transcript_38380:3111-3377(+)